MTPNSNDGAAVYKLNVQDVPVDGFWSITVYNAKGFFDLNQYNAYSVNNITAKKNADGSVAVQFGGCDGKIQNCLPTMPGWYYMARLYHPRAEALNGAWKFPEARLANRPPSIVAADILNHGVTLTHKLLRAKAVAADVTRFL